MLCNFTNWRCLAFECGFIMFFCCKCNGYRLGNSVYIVKIKPRNIGEINLFDITAIIRAKNNIGNACPLGGKYLFFDTTYGGNISTQSNLARHGDIRPDLSMSKSRKHGYKDGDTSRRTILGGCPFRNMNMYITRGYGRSTYS